MREDRRLLAALPVWANRMRSDLLMLLLDASLVSLSLMAILLIRDGGPPNPDTWRQALAFLPVVIAVFLVVGWASASTGTCGAMPASTRHVGSSRPARCRWRCSA